MAIHFFPVPCVCLFVLNPGTGLDFQPECNRSSTVYYSNVVGSSNTVYYSRSSQTLGRRDLEIKVVFFYVYCILLTDDEQAHLCFNRLDVYTVHHSRVLLD